jgi:hypothetical protein
MTFPRHDIHLQQQYKVTAILLALFPAEHEMSNWTIHKKICLELYYHNALQQKQNTRILIFSYRKSCYKL